MSMHGEKVDFLFEAVRAGILQGLSSQEAFDEAIEDTIEIYFSDELERAKENKYTEKLMDMTDVELKQACNEAQARLHLSQKELSSRKAKNVGGTE